MSDKCNVPPEGWYCTREPGHDGPCAAWPSTHELTAAEIDDILLKVGTTGVEQGWFQRGEVVAAVKEAVKCVVWKL